MVKKIDVLKDGYDFYTKPEFMLHTLAIAGVEVFEVLLKPIIAKILMSLVYVIPLLVLGFFKTNRTQLEMDEKSAQNATYSVIQERTVWRIAFEHVWGFLFEVGYVAGYSAMYGTFLEAVSLVDLYSAKKMKTWGINTELVFSKRMARGNIDPSFLREVAESKTEHEQSEGFDPKELDPGMVLYKFSADLSRFQKQVDSLQDMSRQLREKELDLERTRETIEYETLRLKRFYDYLGESNLEEYARISLNSSIPRLLGKLYSYDWNDLGGQYGSDFQLRVQEIAENEAYDPRVRQKLQELIDSNSGLENYAVNLVKFSELEEFQKREVQDDLGPALKVSSVLAFLEFQMEAINEIKMQNEKLRELEIRRGELVDAIRNQKLAKSTYQDSMLRNFQRWYDVIIESESYDSLLPPTFSFGLAPNNVQQMEKFFDSVKKNMNISSLIESIEEVDLGDLSFLRNGFKQDVVAQTRMQITEELEAMDKVVRSESLVAESKVDIKNIDDMSIPRETTSLQNWIQFQKTRIVAKGIASAYLDSLSEDQLSDKRMALYILFLQVWTSIFSL